ncbi:MAG: YhcH/YjgK/YiaL family protein [Sphaerochaeta sp.]
MIYDDLSDLSRYNSLIDELPNVLNILESKRWEEASVGKKTCHYPRISYELGEYTSSAEPRLYQVFKEKTRVHILLSGEELMAVSWPEHARSLSFDQEGKASLGADPIGVIHAKPGHFALFMPGEPHTVGMESPGNRTKVRKLIFTIIE